MDHFVSTYQKDYEWKGLGFSSMSKKPCDCEITRKELTSTLQVMYQVMGDSQEWSRVCPMGQLIDPKLYLAQINLPDPLSSNVEKENPILHELLRTAPTDKVMKCVEEDRAKTTYQADYDHKDFSKFPCPIDTPETPRKKIKTIEPCPSTSKPETTKYTSAKKMFREKFQGSPENRGAFLKCGKVKYSKQATLGGKKFDDGCIEQDCGGESDSKEPILETEYRDIINSTGEKLMRPKRKKKVLVNSISGNK